MLFVIAALLLASVSSFAKSDEIESDRISLFVASQKLLEKTKAVPKNMLGLFMTNFGEGSEFNVGMQFERSLNDSDQIRVSSDAIYLNEESSVALFVTLKAFPVSRKTIPFFIGIGAGIQDVKDFRNSISYHLTTGFEITDNFFAEMRYVGSDIGFSINNLYPFVGFKLSF